MYEIPFKNKITITGVVYQDSIMDSTGITIFPISTCRPKISEDEFSLCDDIMIEGYTIYSRNTEQYKVGDLITITGTGIVIRNREKLTCPICGQKNEDTSNPRFGILTDVILKKEVPATSDESNYRKAIKYLEENTNKNNWNNVIEIEDLETTSIKVFNNKALGGDLMSYHLYEDIMMSAIYQSPDIKSMPDNYKGTYSFIGNLALVQDFHDSFNCKHCDSWVKIDNKIPYVFCISRPKMKITSIFNNFSA